MYEEKVKDSIFGRKCFTDILQEFHYYQLDARFTKNKGNFSFVEKGRSLQFHLEQALFSRAGAKYFSMVASFDFYGREELRRERQLH